MWRVWIRDFADWVTLLWFRDPVVGLELVGSGLVFGDIAGLVCDVGSWDDQCLDPLIERRWQDGDFPFLPKRKFC